MAKKSVPPSFKQHQFKKGGGTVGKPKGPKK